jgi:hypothetical protein
MGWLIAALVIAGLWAITRYYLSGPDLGRFDQGVSAAIGDDLEPSAEHHEVLQLLNELSSAGTEAVVLSRWAVRRAIGSSPASLPG